MVATWSTKTNINLQFRVGGGIKGWLEEEWYWRLIYRMVGLAPIFIHSFPWQGDINIDNNIWKLLTELNQKSYSIFNIRFLIKLRILKYINLCTFSTDIVSTAPLSVEERFLLRNICIKIRFVSKLYINCIIIECHSQCSIFWGIH